MVAASGSAAASTLNQERRPNALRVSPESVTPTVLWSRASNLWRSVSADSLRGDLPGPLETKELLDAIDEIFAAWLGERGVLFEAP